MGLGTLAIKNGGICISSIELILLLLLLLLKYSSIESGFFLGLRRKIIRDEVQCISQSVLARIMLTCKRPELT